MKFPLSKPIMVENQQVKVLEISEDVTAEDMDAMDAVEGENKKARVMIAHLAKVPLSSIGMMSAPDFVRLNSLVKPFLVGGPPTGGTSAETSRTSATSGPTKSSE